MTTGASVLQRQEILGIRTLADFQSYQPQVWAGYSRNGIKKPVRAAKDRVQLFSPEPLNFLILYKTLLNSYSHQKNISYNHKHFNLDFQ